MKKSTLALITLLIVLVVPGNLYAQDFRLGLKASPTITWLKPDTEQYSSEGIRLGFTYGLLTEFLLAEHYSFLTGAQINYIGGKLSYPDIRENTEGQNERTYNLQYLEIPLTLKMKTREIGYNTYFALFGFGPSVNLRARASDTFAYGTEDVTRNEERIDIKSDIPFFRVSLIVGIGMEYSLGGNTAVVTGLTFNNGFTNVLKGENPITNRSQNAKANFLEITFGILF
jgi:hypothetical protein